MKHVFILAIVAAALFFFTPVGGCVRHAVRPTAEYSDPLDSLDDYGANRFEFASYLYQNPEYVFDRSPLAEQSGHVTPLPSFVKVSDDASLAVVSVPTNSRFYESYDNIVFYGNPDYFDIKMEILEDMGGRVKQIHRLTWHSLTYYIILMNGEDARTDDSTMDMVAVLSLDLAMNLTREDAFVTGSGRALSLIEMDTAGVFPLHPSMLLDYWGIRYDPGDEKNPPKLYVQLIEEDAARLTHAALVYQWSREKFRYVGHGTVPAELL